MTHPGGRPQLYDRKIVSEKLLKWAALDDSINVNKFLAFNDLSPTTFFRWVDEDKEFRESYNKAKTFIAFRREERLNEQKLHVKAYDLNAYAYDAVARRNKIKMAEIESNLKSKSEMPANEEYLKKDDEIIRLKYELMQLKAKQSDTIPETDNEL